MSKFLNKPVAYLQVDDFDANGDLVNPQIPHDIPVVIMAQANFCGYCTQAKPAFQEFANKNVGKVFCATIQADGNMPGEKELGNKLKSLKPDFRGYPDYLKFVGGKNVTINIKGRGVAELEEFAFN